MMPDYQYVAWFCDHSRQPDDQDYEWPACFVIAAADDREAQASGDRLASDYSHRHRGCEFLRSYLDPEQWREGDAPRVVAGDAVRDEVIGW